MVERISLTATWSNDYFPKEHELLHIDKQIDFSFVEEEVKDLYCTDNGRPSYPPVQMFRILFLEYYYNLSDVEVIKQLQVNILFRRFVGLSLEDPVPDDSSLSVFRDRLGEERFQRLFAGFVRQCKEQGLLGQRLKLMDATHIIADVAVPSTINLLRDGRRRVLKRIEERRGRQEDLEAFRPDGRTHLRYSKEQLAEEVDKTRGLVVKVKGTYPEAEEEVALLEEVVNPKGKRTLVSLVDPDARFGHKTPKKSFAGYKAHVVEDSTSELVTSVEVLPGNANEGKHDRAKRLLEKEEQQGLHHEAVAADSLYDNKDNYELAERLQMTAYIPGRREGRRAQDFDYCNETDQLICPRGKRSIGKARSRKGSLYYFSTTECGQCERESCYQARKAG